MNFEFNQRNIIVILAFILFFLLAFSDKGNNVEGYVPSAWGRRYRRGERIPDKVLDELKRKEVDRLIRRRRRKLRRWTRYPGWYGPDHIVDLGYPGYPPVIPPPAQEEETPAPPVVTVVQEETPRRRFDIGTNIAAVSIIGLIVLGVLFYFSQR